MLEVITGCMFSGKTAELIRLLERMRIAKLKIAVFKPKIDTRTQNQIKSRNGNELEALVINDPKEILDYVVQNQVDVIAIDEAQFFSEELVDVCDELADLSYHVIVAGLDTDYLDKPFETMAQLIAKADKITKLTAVCMECGAEATKTYRWRNRKDRIIVGDSDMYKALCRKCYAMNMRAKHKRPINMRFGYEPRTKTSK